MVRWQELTPSDVDLKSLSDFILEKGHPVHMNSLARRVVRSILENVQRNRTYAPGDEYTPGEVIFLDEGRATVRSVEQGENSRQGHFKILTLVLPDGQEKYLAAEVPGAPASEYLPVAEDQIDSVMKEYGEFVRDAIHKALADDGRFAWFQGTRGDEWCLYEMLPRIKEDEVSQILILLRSRPGDSALIPYPTEEIVKTLWGVEDDGSNKYLLKSFGVNVVLQQDMRIRWMGNGWVLQEEW